MTRPITITQDQVARIIAGAMKAGLPISRVSFQNGRLDIFTGDQTEVDISDNGENIESLEDWQRWRDKAGESAT